MSKPSVIITDHAVLRYLERIMELDLDQLREKLARDMAPAAAMGAKSYTDPNGATFVFERNKLNGCVYVATVITDKMRRNGTHKRRERRLEMQGGTVR